MKQLLEKVFGQNHISKSAAIESIKFAEKHFNFEVPRDYVEFLQLSNGIEGQTNNNYLVCWSIEELIDLNEAYHVKEFIDNIVFGSDGADEAYCFDISADAIIKMPFIGMGYVANEKIANSFKQFLESQF